MMQIETSTFFRHSVHADPQARRGVASVQENWRSGSRKLEAVMTDIQPLDM